MARLDLERSQQQVAALSRKVDVRLPGKGNSNSHGARPVLLIITTIKWMRTSRLSIKNSFSLPSPHDTPAPVLRLLESDLTRPAPRGRRRGPKNVNVNPVLCLSNICTTTSTRNSRNSQNGFVLAILWTSSPLGAGAIQHSRPCDTNVTQRCTPTQD